MEHIQGVPDYAAEGPVIHGATTNFSPDYAPEEIYEIAAKLMASGGISPLQPNDGKHARFQGSVSDSPGAKAQPVREDVSTKANVLSK